MSANPIVLSLIEGEERLADRLIQAGLRTVNDHHREQFKRFGVEIVEAGRCGHP